MVNPGPGILLIAEPFLKDPNFSRTVVFLCDHQDEGSFGFVINRVFGHTLNELMNDLDELKLPVFYGGPVQMDTIHFLHQYPDKIPAGIEIAHGIYWGGDFEVVKELVSNYQLTEDEIKFFTGYSGWTAGQLEQELRENTWIVTDKFSTDTLFKHNEQNLWKDVVRGMGNRYAHIANFPENPELN